MEKLWLDVKLGVRGLVKSPRFTVVAVLSVALGIGANLTILGAVDAVMLAPLGYEDEGQLVALSSTAPAEGLSFRGNFLPDFWFWREHAESFDEVAFYGWRSWTLEEGSRVERVESVAVSANLFRMLGVEPAIGRHFEPSDEIAGAGDVVLLSHGLWQRVWGGDPSVVGRSIRLDQTPVTIIGVMPPETDIPSRRAELYRPVGYLENYEFSPYGREERDFEVIAHLSDDVNIEGAKTEMRGLSTTLAEMFPTTNAGWQAEVAPLREHVAGSARLPLLLALAAVTIVLLIACVNVANLVLVRAIQKTRELALREAMGAGRGRLVQQQIVECLVLTLSGGVLGVLVASWLTRLLLHFEPGILPRTEAFGLSETTLVAAVGLSVLMGVVFGLVSSFHRIPSLAASLKDGSGAVGASRRQQRARMALIGGQMALALTLLVGAGLLGKALSDLSRVEPGFEAEGVYASHVILGGRYRSDIEARRVYFKQLIENVRAIPGVSRAALSTTPPIPGMGIQIETPYRGDDGIQVTEPDAPRAAFRVIGPGYFEAIGTPLLRGRDFTDRDTAEAPAVAIVNQTLAGRAFPGEDPVGRHLELFLFGERRRFEVVAMSADTRFAGLDEPTRPAFFLVHPQMPFLGVGVVARTTLGPATYGEVIRRTVLATDPAHPVMRVESLEDALAGSLARERFYSVLLGLFAGVALLLAASGIYGVFSYWVGQRTREMGLRLALGARPGDVKRLILGHGARVAAPSLAAGVVLALGVSRALASTFRGVGVVEPVVLVSAVVLVGGVAALACLVPATTASKVAPTVALRSD